MAHRYEFLEAAARDLFKLTRYSQPLLDAIATIHIPAILADPCRTGEPKKGDLSRIWADDLRVKGVAYRLVYELDGDLVRFIAIGPRAPE